MAAQLAQLHQQASLSARQQQLMAAVEVMGADHREWVLDERKSSNSGLAIATLASMTAGMEPLPTTDSDLAAAPFFADVADAFDVLDEAMANVGLILNSARYLHRVERFEDAYARDEQVDIICTDLVNLDMP